MNVSNVCSVLHQKKIVKCHELFWNVWCHSAMNRRFRFLGDLSRSLSTKKFTLCHNNEAWNCRKVNWFDVRYMTTENSHDFGTPCISPTAEYEDSWNARRRGLRPIESALVGVSISMLNYDGVTLLWEAFARIDRVWSFVFTCLKDVIFHRNERSVVTAELLLFHHRPRYCDVSILCIATAQRLRYSAVAWS